VSPTRPRLPVCALVAALVAAPPALAQAPGQGPGWTVEVSPQVAYFRGHTTYRISDSDAFSSVSSELEFPIETGGLGLRARFARDRPRGRGGPAFEIGGFLSVQARTGTMKDSDWIAGQAEIDEVGAPHDGKDIYSESKADLSARMLDVRAAWEVDALAPGVVLAPMFGIFYQRFEFQVHDGTQWGYGSWNTPTYTGSIVGAALEYKVRSIVPYVGGRASLARGPFRASAELWGSPLADVADEDDHLLRQKLSKTDASGTAWSAAVAAGFTVGPRDTLRAEASIVRLRAEGTQIQSFYGGPYAGMSGSIPSTITSSRAAFLVSYSHAL
jgi:outer membrane protease